MQFEARKVALKQDKTGYILTLSLHPDEIPEELMRDFVGARYGCALVRIQDDETPRTYTNRVQRAGILCRDESFQRFAGVSSEEDAASAICLRCSIASRAELNGNREAQDEFDSMLHEYEEWSLNNDSF